jgi:hypothetical protein
MERLPDVPAVLWTVSSVLWIATFVGLAAAAWLRFRNTASGLLLGASFFCTALVNAAGLIFHVLVTARPPFDQTRTLIVSGVQSVLHFLLVLLAVAGIALIPRSLRKLAR